MDEQNRASTTSLSYVSSEDVETLCHNIKQPGGAAAGDSGGANFRHMIS